MYVCAHVQLGISKSVFLCFYLRVEHNGAAVTNKSAVNAAEMRLDERPDSARPISLLFLPCAHSLFTASHPLSGSPLLPPRSSTLLLSLSLFEGQNKIKATVASSSKWEFPNQAWTPCLENLISCEGKPLSLFSVSNSCTVEGRECAQNRRGS